MFDTLIVEPFLQILLAGFLGALVGFEREHKGKEAGFRTFALVSIGACFFTIASGFFRAGAGADATFFTIDPSRVIQAVAIGIGFLGSGIIIHKKAQIEGLTTAAALWATAAIGMGIGLKLYVLSIFSGIFIVAILALFEIVEKRIFKKK